MSVRLRDQLRSRDESEEKRRVKRIKVVLRILAHDSYIGDDTIWINLFNND